jgi:hypothetical protein
MLDRQRLDLMLLAIDLLKNVHPLQYLFKNHNNSGRKIDFLPITNFSDWKINPRITPKMFHDHIKIISLLFWFDDI